MFVVNPSAEMEFLNFPGNLIDRKNDNWETKKIRDSSDLVFFLTKEYSCFAFRFSTDYAQKENPGA